MKRDIKMKLPNNYYTDQFRKLSIQSITDLTTNETVKIQLSNDMGISNHMNIDSIALIDIYNVLQEMNERTRNN